MEYTATVLSSTINLTKTIIGAGMLAIPFAFSKDGIFFGTFLTILAAATSAYGLYLLAKSSKMLDSPRTSSFFTLCAITYPNFSLIFDFSMFVQCFGVALSYIVLIGDVFSRVLGGSREQWIYLSTIIIIPLSLLKNLDSLKYTSMVGLFAIAYIVLFIISTFFIELPTLDFSVLQISWFKVSSFTGLLSTFSILIFAFTASMNIFSICNEMKENTLHNINKVISISVGLSAFLFIVVGASGYLTFGYSTLGNVILNYNPNSVFTKVGQLSLGSVILLSFPLLFHPLRIATNNMVFWIEKNVLQKQHHASETQPLLLNRSHSQGSTQTSLRRQHTANSSLIDETSLIQEAEANEVSFPDSKFYSITAILLLSLYVLGLNVREFALVLSLVGATGSTAISFILPGMFGYKLFKDIPNSGHIVKGSIALIIFGFGVMFLSVFATLYFPQ